jgi:hypothetical protein
MKFSQIIDKSFIGKFVDKKVPIWQQINPDKFYVENIRQFFNLSTRIAKFFCDVAVRQGIFVKNFELYCPNEGRAIGTYKSKNDIPKTIECQNCQLLEKKYQFDTSNCQVEEFYTLVKK